MKNYHCSSPLIFLLLGSFISIQLLSSSHSLRDSIGENHVLKNDETLISESGIFILGFFDGKNMNIEGRATKTMYLGLWYNFSIDTVVWVANRENPVTKSFAALQLDEKGRLNILQSQTSLNMMNSNDSVDVIWSTNSSILKENTKTTNQTVAKLSDSGNLIVINVGRQIWQSFDYPTDTYLPGMKLGFDKIRKKEWFLTCWKRPGDPSKGDFMFKIDTGSSKQYYFIVNNQKKFRIGPWNGAWFNGLNGMLISEGMYKFVDNDTMTFFTYDGDVAKGMYIRSTIFPNTTVSILVWNNKGSKWVVLDHWNILQPNWVLNIGIEGAEDNCHLYSMCGPNSICKSQHANPCECLDGFQPKSETSWVTKNFTLGCQRKEKINCSDADVFLDINKLKIPDTTNSTIHKNMTLSDCETTCRYNCSCVAYAPLYLAGYNPRGCILWFGDLLDTNLVHQDAQNLYLRSTNSLLPNKDSGETKKKPLIIATVSTGVFIILSSLAILLWIKVKKKKKKKTILQKGALTAVNLMGKDDVSLFDISVIFSATNNFSSENKIGQGGFGSVYKGKMADDKDIAVKRLSKGSGQGLDEFKNEVMLIAKLQHKNLVRLLGYCMEGDERILVFEFMKNKSLDTIIFGDNRNMLDWPNRTKIIIGIARGLLYLHQDSRLKIIHRDLKAANILLDDAMDPKITDFGTARLFDADQMEDNTRRIIGTYGYMSPEYASGGNFSIKSDVFSFGVLLLEIISGRKNRVFYKYDSNLNILEEAWILFNDQKSIMLLDKTLCSSSFISEVNRFIKIGLLCVQDRAIDRPTMSDVLFMLVNEIAIVQEPKKPAFCNDRKHKSSADRVNFSNNDVTFTKIEGR